MNHTIIIALKDRCDVGIAHSPNGVPSQLLIDKICKDGIWADIGGKRVYIPGHNISHLQIEAHEIPPQVPETAPLTLG